ncbi:MAG: hypothetical protein M3439_05435 [Chloroflexota bacterium]|nr:hypothetical protein [Chloroflexota bacterium]
MSKWLSFALTSLMLVLALAACGGGGEDDDADDADPTVIATTGASIAATEPATATSTRPTGGSDSAASPVASPTSSPVEATPTVGGTAPSRPIVTAVPTEPAPTPTTAAMGVPEVEAELMAALLQPEDFSSDWTQDTFGPMEVDTDDSDELCGQPSFPDRHERIAGVEAEYSLEGSEPAFVLENIVLFPEETAIAALAYAREVSSCGEWTDEDGQTFTITPLDGPEYGDESYTASIQFEIGGSPYYGEYVFIRMGGAIATVAFVTIDDADVTQLQPYVGVAAERLQDAAISDGRADSELMDLLLVAEDIALIDAVNVWETGEPMDSTDEDRFSVCDAPSFPDALGAVDEFGHELYADEDVGPVAIHTVVQMFDGDGATAMEWIRTELSCPSWTDEDGDYEVTDSGDLDVGDDTYWLIVTIVAPDGSGDTVQIGFGFTQIGDYISVVGLAAEDSIDPELFGAIIALGAEKVFAGTP